MDKLYISSKKNLQTSADPKISQQRMLKLQYTQLKSVAFFFVCISMEPLNNYLWIQYSKSFYYEVGNLDCVIFISHSIGPKSASSWFIRQKHCHTKSARSLMNMHSLALPSPSVEIFQQRHFTSEGFRLVLEGPLKSIWHQLLPGM